MAQTARQVRADWRWWKRLENVLPWKLYGFSYRYSATFFTSEHDTIDLLGSQAEQIWEACTNATNTNR